MPAIFLGTSGYHPSAVRHTAGVLVPEAGLLMDAGSGTFRLPELYAPAADAGKELDLVLSHAHLDHIIGLTFFILWLMEEDRLTTVRLHGRQDVLEAIDRHLFSELIFPVKIPFETHAVEPGDTVSLQNGHELVLWDQPHRGPTFGMRLTNASGRSLAYCTDMTARPGEAINEIAGVDALIHECHFSNEHAEFSERTGHSHLSAAATRAAESDAKHTYLTHINPYYDPHDPLDLESVASICNRLTVATDLMQVPWDE